MWPKPTAPWTPDQVNVPHSCSGNSPEKMFAVPDAPVSHGRWLAHCCAAVIDTLQLAALADVAATSAPTSTAAAMPKRSNALRPFDVLMYCLPSRGGRPPLCAPTPT